MTEFVTSLFLPAVIAGVSWPLVMLLRHLGGVGIDALKAVQSNQEASALARTAAMVGERLIVVIDGVIDDAANDVTGTFAKFQRPESPGGMRITPDEWRQIRDELASRAADGFGTSWIMRLLSVLGSGPEAAVVDASMAKAIAMPHIKNAVETRVAERTDLALSSGIRGAAPVAFGEVPAVTSSAPLSPAQD